MKKCIILANGKPPRKNIIIFFQKDGFDTIICADGGADSALRLGLTPDFIIGDLDSISKEAIKKFKSTSKILQYKRQNDTDVEKCLKFAIKNKFDEALLIGVTGNRLDHTICNLGIVLKFFSKIKLSLVAENSYLKPYTGDFRLKTQKGEIISLYGFDKKTKITSKGLKYSLKNISLPFGEKDSTSNISTSNSIQLKIRNGIIFIIRDFNFIKKYDLFQFD
ncbi:MAG: thiamine diphosphokinase [Bacteroidetes bacterium]|nr:thiamine diphosphokinase [Bacteroidota bacterium]